MPRGSPPFKRTEFDLLQALGSGSSALRANGVQPAVIHAYVEAANDPDTDLVTWLLQGAPLGIARPVTPQGIFLPTRHNRPRL